MIRERNILLRSYRLTKTSLLPPPTNLKFFTSVLRLSRDLSLCYTLRNILFTAVPLRRLTFFFYIYAGWLIHSAPNHKQQLPESQTRQGNNLSVINNINTTFATHTFATHHTTLCNIHFPLHHFAALAPLRNPPLRNRKKKNTA